MTRARFPFKPAALPFGLLAACLIAVVPLAAQSLKWNEQDGVAWATPAATVRVDRAEGEIGPLLRIGPQNRPIPLGVPVVTSDGKDRLTLVYVVILPDGIRLEIRRRLEARISESSCDLVETFELRPASPIRQDVEIVRPFAIGKGASEMESPGDCVLPLKSGWAKTCPLTSGPLEAEYRLGHWIGGEGAAELALPVVQADHAGRWRAAVCADPRFSAKFSLRRGANEVAGEVRYRYLASRVPIDGVETRSFGFALNRTPPSAEPFGRSLDAFFRLMLPDVPPGPRWLHDIDMVSYDYLSDGGEGWLRDAEKLAEWLSPGERKRVAMCFHGWYDYLGVYAYDESAGRMKREWTAMPGTRKVRFSVEGMKAKLKSARDLGFRVLLYFGDGLIQDSGAPGFRAAWNLVNDKGESNRPTWEGPDTLGKTFIRNPAHPDVARWYNGYLDALLRDFGDVVDGFVWDETYYVRQSDIMEKPSPAYCARAMLDLVQSLTARVEAYDPEKVFLSSDCVGFPFVPESAGYGMVADGNFQDTWCHPEAFAPALLPYWRNTTWGCIWADIIHFHWMEWGVEHFGAPVAFSNGFGDDCGPSEWNADQKAAFLGLFRKRRTGPGPVRYMTEDPAKLVAERGPDVVESDPIPPAAAGEVNWALISNGSRARASSEIGEKDKRYPPDGAIDGIRGPEGWGKGHGWAAPAGPRPPWLEIEFPEPRPVVRFVVTTFHSRDESARQSGVLDYVIEAWDDALGRWSPVVREEKGRVRVSRVHVLGAPVVTRKFRISVLKVAFGAVGVARLLQVEAWGGSSY